MCGIYLLCHLILFHTHSVLYAMHERPCFFVILNSILTSSRWLLINNYDPAHQLQWLIDTLQEAEDNGEKVGFILEREFSF